MSSQIHFRNILITGCGGDIAQGVCKIIKRNGIADKVIGTDIHDFHSGLSIFDKCLCIPKATDERYFATLDSILDSEKIDVIIPISEIEIQNFLGKGRSYKGVPVLMASDNVIKIGLDKLFTAKFLEVNDLAYPWTLPASEGLPKDYPCIKKLRRGQGSKNLRIIENIDVARVYLKEDGDFLWQELLSPDDQEYTCGIYVSSEGDIRTIVIRRRLQGGFTGSGVVVDDDSINNYIVSLASKLKFQGSVNFQLRLTKKGPVLFEINPRFSSTVVFRHMLGFEDVVWSLQELARYPIESYRSAKAGKRIFRTSSEYIY